MRARCSLFLLLAWSLPVHAQSPCTWRNVVRGEFEQTCPLPTAAELLDADSASALALKPADEPSQARVVAALRSLAGKARAEGPWGAAFADRVDQLLQHLNPSQCDKTWELAFSELRAPITPLDTCQCAFEVASDGDPSHACFRFAQPGGAALPACELPRLRVVDLADWPQAARAYVLLDQARAALLALNASCRATAIQRLKSAHQRWHTLATRGYVQYPWELWFSRAISDDYGNYSRCFASDPKCSGEEGLDPETLRPIFLHPGVGLGFPGFGKHDAKVSAQGRLVIMVEAIGLNIYARDFKEYLGASLGVGFQDANFARPRLGAFVHLSRYLQVGYLLGVVSETAGNGTLYLSVDILGWTNRSLGLTEPPAP